MTVDLEDRLSGLLARAADAVTVREDPQRAVDADPPQRPRPWWPVVAAAAVVLAGTGAVIALRDPDDPDGVVREQPADPPGALYMLPEGLEGWTVANGSTHTGESGSAVRAIMVGVPSGDGFVDPVSVVVVPEDTIDVDGSWDSLDLASESVLVETGTSWVRMVQPQGDFVLTGTGDQGAEWLIARAFGDIELTPDGVPTLVPESPLEEIGSFRSDSREPVQSSYFEVSHQDDLVVVETANHDALLNVGPTGYVESVEPVIVNGASGWHASRRDDDGEWNAVGWMATPNRTVFVSGHELFDVVLEVAESLVIVEAETWADATGCPCG